MKIWLLQKRYEVDNEIQDEEILPSFEKETLLKKLEELKDDLVKELPKKYDNNIEIEEGKYSFSIYINNRDYLYEACVWEQEII